VGLERGPISLVSTTEELLDRKVAAPVYKTENTAVGIRHADHVAPSIRKSWHHFADKRRSPDRYSSLAGLDHGVIFIASVESTHDTLTEIVIWPMMEFSGCGSSDKVPPVQFTRHLYSQAVGSN
jgi:hypothetical protein